MKRSLLLSLLMLCCVAAFAQTPPHFYNATNPLQRTYGFATSNQKVQFWYAPGQFTAPTPAQSGVITSLWFKAYDNVTNAVITNLEVKMGQPASGTAFSSNSFVTAGMNTVRPAADLSIASVSATSWIEIPLTTGFMYDNTKPLIVEISQTAVTNGFRIYFQSIVTANRTIYATSSTASSGTFETTLLAGAGVTIQYPCTAPYNFSISNVGTHSADFNWQYQYPNLKHFEFVIDQSPLDPPGSNYQPYQTPPLHLDTFQPATCYYVHIRTNCTAPSYLDTIAQTWLLDSFCTLPTCDAPPVTIDVNKITSTTAMVSWTAVPNVLKYEYAVSIDTVPPQGGHFTTYTQLQLKGLHPNYPYYFYVRAYCTPIPVSDWSRTPFHTAITTGVDDVAGDGFVVEAYPNPAGNTVTIVSADRGNDARITIVDMTGKLVKTAAITDDRTTVSLDGLTAGLYFVRYTDEAHSQVIKLTKE